MQNADFAQCCRLNYTYEFNSASAGYRHIAQSQPESQSQSVIGSLYGEFCVCDAYQPPASQDISTMRNVVGLESIRKSVADFLHLSLTLEPFRLPLSFSSQSFWHSIVAPCFFVLISESLRSAFTFTFCLFLCVDFTVAFALSCNSDTSSTSTVSIAYSNLFNFSLECMFWLLVLFVRELCNTYSVFSIILFLGN